MLSSLPLTRVRLTVDSASTLSARRPIRCPRSRRGEDRLRSRPRSSTFRPRPSSQRGHSSRLRSLSSVKARRRTRPLRLRSKAFTSPTLPPSYPLMSRPSITLLTLPLPSPLASSPQHLMIPPSPHPFRHSTVANSPTHSSTLLRDRRACISLVNLPTLVSSATSLPPLPLIISPTSAGVLRTKTWTVYRRCRHPKTIWPSIVVLRFDTFPLRAWTTSNLYDSVRSRKDRRWRMDRAMSSLRRRTCTSARRSSRNSMKSFYGSYRTFVTIVRILSSIGKECRLSAGAQRIEPTRRERKCISR